MLFFLKKMGAFKSLFFIKEIIGHIVLGIRVIRVIRVYYWQFFDLEKARILRLILLLCSLFLQTFITRSLRQEINLKESVPLLSFARFLLPSLAERIE